MNKSRKIWHALAFVAVFALAIAVTMLLWNGLIPGIIGWSAINYWQAAGLLILCRMLFGGFGHHWRGGHNKCHHHKIHERFHEKLKGMSREQKREYLRKRMGEMHNPEAFRDFPNIDDK